MAKANKTVETKASVAAYIKAIKDEKRRKDVSALIGLLEKNIGLEPKMWGTAIVGFGSYHYKYESGREGDAPLVGLASRSGAIVLYLAADENREGLLAKFGKHKAEKGCIYIKTLEDVDSGILVKMAQNAIRHYQELYPVK